MIRCIAIDDEPLALKQLSNYIEKTPILELMGNFESAILALSFLEENEIDLMFVDINMPDLSGIDFVKSLVNAPKVIFTTAYSEFALEGFKVDAIDYILKPISYPDFLKASSKAKSWFDTQSSRKKNENEKNDFLFVKSEYKLLRVKFSNIKYIESMREYIRIHLLEGKSIMSLTRMKNIESSLPKDMFMRIHRSYIVNLDQIKAIERNRILFDREKSIPVSEQYLENFKKYINEKFLK